MFCLMFVLVSAAQTEDISSMVQTINELSNGVKQNDRHIKNIQNSQIEMDKKLNEEMSGFVSSHEKSTQLMSKQFLKFQDDIRKDIVLINDAVENQKKLREKIHKRQKIHFLIVYIFLFTCILGVVFIFFYYSKLLKDFDLFQHKCMKDLKNETISMVDNSTLLATAQVQELSRDLQQKILEVNESVNAMNLSSKEKIDKLNTLTEQQLSELRQKIKEMQKEQNDQLKTLESLNGMAENLSLLSEKISEIKEETTKTILLNQAKNQDQFRDISVRIQRLSQTVSATESRIPKDDA